MTPEQQQAQMDLEAAENQPLCEGEDVAIAEKTCEVTLTRVIEWSGSSNCEEVVIGFVDSRSTAAVEWQASVGSQVVASGTWDSDSEPTKVLTFVYGSEISAESEGGGETTTVTCMGTIR
ncbi:MAG: hypothetical protein J0651_02100, partial [Actinobacteria bacterium]|nr:hypothetical protein [Actinomycetota bacterium]